MRAWQLAKKRANDPTYQQALYRMPSSYRREHMVDANMTIEEINERTKKWIEENVPYEYRGVICTCLQPTHSGNDVQTCASCKKWSRFLLSKCILCKEIHFNWYVHHRRTAGDHAARNPERFVDVSSKYPDRTTVNSATLCWDCLCEFDPPIEGDFKIELEKQELRPLGEILSDSLDFDLESPF